MKIEVRVRPRSLRRKVELASDGALLVSVHEPAEDGRANAAVIDLLADYLHVPKRTITIVVGHRSRKKIVHIAAPIGLERFNTHNRSQRR